MSINDYKNEIPCPCGSGVAQRKFSNFTLTYGLTANEKRSGSNVKRKEMAEFVKDQRETRKKAYSPDSREAKSNELWLGKEGQDGITSLPIDKDIKS